MKKSKLLFILILGLNLLLIQTSNAQKLKNGIYEIEYKIDTVFLKSKSVEFNKTKNYKCTKKIIATKYCDLIDKKFKAKYAVLVNAKNEFGTKTNKFIILNDSLPLSNVSYSDSLVRQYYEMSFNIDSNNRSWNYTGSEGFLSMYSDYQNFASEYDLQQEWKNKKNVDRDFNYQNFYQQKDTFYLKYNSAKIYNDSITSHYDKENFNYLEPRPIYDYCHFTTLEKVSAFKLKTAKNYIDILPIKQTIAFYIKNNKINLKAGNFIAISSYSDEWIFGELISNDGKTTAGKVYKEDLISTENLSLKTVYLNGLILKIKYRLDEEGSFPSENGEIYSIKIYKNNVLKQVLQNPGIIYNLDNLLNKIDVNFDGYKDLEIYGHDGGAGPNTGNNYYIFNPKTKKFVFNQALSECTQTEINSKNKCISSHYRDGAATHGSIKYKWIKGELTQVEFYQTYFLTDDKVEVTHQFLKNGKMRGKTRIVNAKDLNRLD